MLHQVLALTTWILKCTGCFQNIAVSSPWEYCVLAAVWHGAWECNSSVEKCLAGISQSHVLCALPGNECLSPPSPHCPWQPQQGGTQTWRDKCPLPQQQLLLLFICLPSFLPHFCTCNSYAITFPQFNTAFSKNSPPGEYGTPGIHPPGKRQSQLSVKAANCHLRSLVAPLISWRVIWLSICHV